MSEYISELINQLRQMEDVNPDIQGLAIVSVKGLPLCSTFSEDVDNEIFSAICATILNISKHASKELICGKVKRILIESVEGIICLQKAGEDAILCVLAKSETSLGDIFQYLNDQPPKTKDVPYPL
ncbi:MAG: roadblock/LC7 domain-containing protein [Candidatus Hodarchaeota archaeon]